MYAEERETLRRCRCGEEPVFVRVINLKEHKFVGYRVYCLKCNIETAAFETKTAAELAWNKGETE